MRHTGTEGNIQTSMERSRLRELGHSLNTREQRADTWPATSASAPSSSQTQERSVEEKDVTESNGSQDPISIDGDNSNDEGPRRRKTATPSSLTEEDGLRKTKSSRSNTTVKPVFTVGSQLRATIFNSWINILLVCVPAGSTKDILRSTLQNKQYTNRP